MKNELLGEEDEKISNYFRGVGSIFFGCFVRITDAPSLVLTFYRSLFAAIFLAPALFVKFRPELKKLTKKDVLLCVISGCFLGLHFSAYFESLRFTSIASSVVLVDTEVFFVAFAMLFFFREKDFQARMDRNFYWHLQEVL